MGVEVQEEEAVVVETYRAVEVVGCDQLWSRHPHLWPEGVTVVVVSVLAVGSIPGRSRGEGARVAVQRRRWPTRRHRLGGPHQAHRVSVEGSAHRVVPHTLANNEFL